MPAGVEALFAFLLAGILALLLVPLTDRLARHVGAIDVPDDQRSLHAVPTPRLGGLAIFVAVLAAALIWLPWDAETRAILVGAALITVLGAFVTKLLSLFRLKQVMQAGLAKFLPWKSLALNAAVSLAAAAPAMVVKTHLDLPPFPLLFVACLAYSVAWLVLAFALRLITVDERMALVGLLQRFPTNAAKFGELIRSF